MPLMNKWSKSPDSQARSPRLRKNDAKVVPVSFSFPLQGGIGRAPLRHSVRHSLQIGFSGIHLFGGLGGTHLPLAADRNDTHFLDGAGHNPVSKFQIQAAGRNNIDLDDAASPGTASNGRFHGRKALAVKPSAGNLVQPVMKDAD